MKKNETNDSKLKYSKYKARELTDFFSEELVYDYITKALDSERQQAFEKHISKSSLTKEQFAQTNSVLNEVESLDRIRISEEILVQLIPQRNNLVEKMRKGLVSQQFQSRKYFYLQYIFLFSAISFFVFLTPWRQLIPLGNFDNQGKVILTEVRNTKEDIKKRIQARQDEMENASKTEFADDATDIVSDSTQTQSAPDVVIPVVPTTKETVQQVKPAPTVAVQEATQTKPGTKVEGATAAATTAAAADTGYVYRGTVRIASLEVNGAKITDYIKSLGGRKAGDVELGWKKGPKVLYYHFTIPESKYEELKNFMENFGRTKLSKDKHPRKMPQGIIRLIVEVEESS